MRSAAGLFDAGALPVRAIRDETVTLRQIKTGREPRLSVTPMLREVLTPPT